MGKPFEYYVGRERIEESSGLSVINDAGQEVIVAPEDFWQYEYDAPPNAILIEEFNEMNAEKVPEKLGGES